MKNFEQEHMYHYDWGTVTAAYWNKYPNLVQNHIKGIDVIDRKIDIDSQTMKLKRIVHLQYFVPKIFRNLFNIDGRGIAVEDIKVNLKKKKLTIKTVNYTLSPFVNSVEKCTYFQKDGYDNNTFYKQSTQINITGLGYMKNLIENTILNVIKEKSKQGIEIMDEVIKRTMNENTQINQNNLYGNSLNKMKSFK
ncbi:MSF1-like protein, putative [Plasmodium vinckei]|uniref:MSF1-like protein, putative n=1 Tax=Plasmodium vinckei TaxID=5860 RepID=A0A6V7SJS6_PLAVN|nr:MSF1-like protein, putative [Plasmodium vinckei]